MHPRNRHRHGYDFAALVAASPELAPFVIDAASGRRSIDFSDDRAVRQLNRALLRSEYGVVSWQIPLAALCPPIPGRADYVHALADLLASDHDEQIPRGAQVRVLDIGVGASVIYPIIGTAEYGWRFVGSECDAGALAAALANVQANPTLQTTVEIRHQVDPQQIFQGVIAGRERFDLCLCNPPFYASAAEAAASNRRKWDKLGRRPRAANPRRNFGGSGAELWCRGGEAAFVTRMVRQSPTYGSRLCWFSALLSRAENLGRIQAELKRAAATTVRVIPMAQGQKQSRLVAWSFLDQQQRRDWRSWSDEAEQRQPL